MYPTFMVFKVFKVSFSRVSVTSDSSVVLANGSVNKKSINTTLSLYLVNELSKQN